MQNTQIQFGAILSYLTIGINIVAGLLYTPWIVQQLGQSNYGLYTLASSLMSLFLVDFGLSAATSRYVAKYRAEGKEQDATVFLGAVYKLYLLIDAVVCALLLVIYFNLGKIYTSLTPVELQSFQVVYIITAVYSLVSFPFVPLDGILKAYEKFIQEKSAVLLGRIVTIVFTVAALLLGAGLYAMVTIHAAAGLISIAYRLVVVLRETPMKPDFSGERKGLYREIFSFSLWITIANIASRLIFAISPTILGVVAGTADIAVFGIVSTIEGYVFTITTAINGLFLAKISRIYSGADTEENIMPLMLRVGRFQFAINILIVIGFALVGQEFIHLWMGPDYADAYLGILLVISPTIFYNSMQIANTALVVRKMVKEQAMIALVCGIGNVLLSFLLSSRFGVLGAAGSISCVYCLKTILYNRVYYRKLKVDLVQFAKKCYVPYIIPCLFTLGAGGGINLLLVNYGWWTLILKIILLTTVFGLGVLFFAISKEEQVSILCLVKRRVYKK